MEGFPFNPMAARGGWIDKVGFDGYLRSIMRPVTIHALPTQSAFAPAADVRLAPRHEVLLDI
ncbi:hypothetical protein COSO111634_14555 [Corallococcus soli]